MTKCVYCNRDAVKEVVDPDGSKYGHCDNCHEDFVSVEQEAHNRIIWEEACKTLKRA